jgi:hypothetical protein
MVTKLQTKAYIKNAVFCDVTSCDSCKNRSFVFLRSIQRLIFTANVPSSPILVTLMEVLRYSETSGVARATRCNIPEHGIIHSHRRESL